MILPRSIYNLTEIFIFCGKKFIDICEILIHFAKDISVFIERDKIEVSFEGV